MNRSRHNSNRKDEKGSALFLILIGVALFAALSYAVSQMLRGGSPEVITEQKSKLYADQVLDYARTVRGAVQSVKISYGCTDSDISFTVTGSDGYQHAPAERDECKVFHNNGGGITPQPGPDNTTWIYQGGTQVNDVGSNGTAADNGELIMYLPIMNEAVCDSINKKLNLPEDIDGDTLPDTIPAAAKFTGTYNVAGVIGVAVAAAASGKHAACLDYDGPTDPAPDSLFYQVIIAR